MPDMIGASVISLMARVGALEQLIARREADSVRVQDTDDGFVF